MVSREATSIRRIVTQAIKAQRWIPRLRWAQVTQTDPLRIQFPGEPAGSTTPVALCRPIVGQQVLTMAWMARMVVLGATRGDGVQVASGATLVSLEAGFTLTHCVIRRVGSVVQLSLRVTRNVAVPAGNHTNIFVGTISSAAFRPLMSSPLSAVTQASCLGCIHATGAIEIAASIGTVTAGTPIDLCGTYIV